MLWRKELAETVAIAPGLSNGTALQLRGRDFLLNMNGYCHDFTRRWWYFPAGHSEGRPDAA